MNRRIKQKMILALALMLIVLTGCNMVAEVQVTPPPDAQDEGGEEQAQPDPGEGIVFEFKDEEYIQMLTEIFYHLPEYQGATVKISGEVYNYGDEHPELPISFAIMRDYVLEGEEDFVAIDCYYEGDIPEGGAWIQVEGQLYEYTLEDEGEQYSSPLLMIQKIETTEAREPLQVTAEAFEHSH